MAARVRPRRAVTDPRGNATRIGYDANAAKKRVAAIGNTTGFAYADTQGNGALSATVTDPRGFATVHRLDATDRPLELTDARGTVMRLSWDQDNPTRIVSAADSPDEAVTDMTYNANGLLTSNTDGERHRTELRYGDGAGRARSSTRSGPTSADGPVRYQHFVSRVADMQELWGLSNEDGWASGLRRRRAAFAVWPHERYADAAAIHAGAERRPERICVAEWLDGWTTDLVEAGRLVRVFPIPSGVTVAVEPERLAEDLRTQLARYRATPRLPRQP